MKEKSAPKLTHSKNQKVKVQIKDSNPRFKVKHQIQSKASKSKIKKLIKIKKSEKSIKNKERIKRKWKFMNNDDCRRAIKATSDSQRTNHQNR